MLRISTSSVAVLLCVTAPLSAQGVDSIEVTPHNVTRPVTQNTGTGVGACQQFMPWAYDANGNRVRQQQTFVWSVSNPGDFDVDTITGGVCARRARLSDTVTTVVTATIKGTEISGTSSFTVIPDPATIVTAPPPATTQPTSRTNRATPAPAANPAGAAGTPTAAGQPQAGGGALDTTLLPPGPAPTNVTVTPISPTTLQIAWGGVAGASGYYLYRSSSVGGQFTPQNTALFQGNLTTDPTLMPNTVAYYKVAAVVPNKSPGFSAAVGGTTLFAPAPASLTATLSPDQKSVALTWPAPTGASGYILYKDGAPVSKTPLRSASYNDTGLIPGRTYRYMVGALYASVKHGEFEGDLTSMPPATVTRTEAMYHVLLVGFKVNRQTRDDPLQNDGKGDEVYIAAQVLEADTLTFRKRELFESQTIGDKNGFPQRLPYGSASPLGGLKTGDDIRFANPWELWKGTLWKRLAPGRNDANGLVVTPTIWEFDGVQTLQRVRYESWRYGMAPMYGPAVGCIQQRKEHTSWGQTGGTKAIVPYTYYLGSTCPWSMGSGVLADINGEDRPIGYLKEGYFSPTSVQLNLHLAEVLLHGAASVDLAVPYADGPAGEGEYVIFLRLERL